MKRLLIPLVAVAGAIGIILFMRKRAEATQALPSYAPPSFAPPKEPFVPGKPTQYVPPKKPSQYTPTPVKSIKPKVKPRPAIKPTPEGIARYEQMTRKKFYGGAQDLWFMKYAMPKGSPRPLELPAFRIETIADFMASSYVHGAAKKALREGKITANYLLPILKSKKVYSIKSDPLGSKIIISEKLPPRMKKLIK